MLAESFVRSGKVRDLYRLDDGRLLLVASDRISAFDVVLPSIIADKGRVLTGLSRFWFAETAGIIANHLLATAPEVLAAAIGAEDGSAGREAPDVGPLDDLRGRLMICRPASVVPIEAVVRGYLAGLGLEGIPRARDGLWDRAPGRPARERPTARADLHAGDQGRSSAHTTRTSPSTG